MNKSNNNRYTLEEYREIMKEIHKKSSKRIGLSRKDENILNKSKENKDVKNENKKKRIEYGGRGLTFESIIEASNMYYEESKLGLIRKIPTPIKVLKIGEKGNIEKGFYEKKSALDFNGILKGGIHIDFDTKETKNKTSFPLGNISEHQLEYMKEIESYGGITFFLVNFREHNECYVLRYSDYLEYMKDNVGVKSIKYSYFSTKLIKQKVEIVAKKQGYIYDYLKVVELLYDIKL